MLMLIVEGLSNGLVEQLNMDSVEKLDGVYEITGQHGVLM